MLKHTLGGPRAGACRGSKGCTSLGGLYGAKTGRLLLKTWGIDAGDARPRACGSKNLFELWQATRSLDTDEIHAPRLQSRKGESLIFPCRRTAGCIDVRAVNVSQA